MKFALGEMTPAAKAALLEGLSRDDADQLTALLQLARAAHALLERLEACASVGEMTPSRVRALLLLTHDFPEGVGTSQLAEALEIRAASVTNLIASMEKLGLVHRRPDPRDRRAVIITVTDEGRRQLNTVRPALLEVAGSITDAFGGVERVALMTLLARLEQVVR